MIRNLFVTNMSNVKTNACMTDKTLRLSWDGLMSYRHAIACDDLEQCYDVVGVIDVVPEDNLKRERRRGVPEGLVILSGYLLVRMSVLASNILALVPRPSPMLEITPQHVSEPTAEEDS